MKFPYKIIVLLVAIVCSSCKKISLDGMTFYTVKGKITDANNKAKANLALNIYTRKTYGVYMGPDKEAEVITANGETDSEGNFKITFPKSDADCYLMLENGYQVIDSVKINSYNSNLVKLENNQFNYYLLDVKTVKITNE